MMDLDERRIAWFRALTGPAIVLLVMAWLDRPVGAREIGKILDIDEHTISNYLRQLSNLNLVARSARYHGFILLQGGRQLVLGTDRSQTAALLESPTGAPTVNKLQSAHDATTATNLIGRSEGDEGAVVEESTGTVENLQSRSPGPARTVNKLQFKNGESTRAALPGKNRPHLRRRVSAARRRVAAAAIGVRAGGRRLKLDDLNRALLEAGIGEPKRSSLARLTYLTPAYVKAWEMQLKKDKGARYSTGLLVHVLECGDPAPPLNENGHLVKCHCAKCRQLDYSRCPYCGEDPCECEEIV
jgi:hypothetical protein